MWHHMCNLDKKQLLGVANISHFTLSFNMATLEINHQDLILCFFLLNFSLPIGSVYGIFTYAYHKEINQMKVNMPYSSPVDLVA